VVAAGTNSCSSLQPLRSDLYVQVSHARQIAAGSVKAGDEAKLDRVAGRFEHDRNRRSCGLGRHRQRSAGRRNYADLTMNQFGRKRRQSIIFAFRPAIFDLDVLALDISCLFQSLVERSQTD
jgi:hypothetical protein